MVMTTTALLRTKALILSTYVKFENLYPETRDLIRPVFEKYQPSTELDLQQRSCEYICLGGAGDDIMDTILQGGVGGGGGVISDFWSATRYLLKKEGMVTFSTLLSLPRHD